MLVYVTLGIGYREAVRARDLGWMGALWSEA